MSEIDIQNAKQIRQPMDVLITMSLADTEISMTYSGYSSAKVADGVLDERSWSMRKLADLQGDGFPLDGSCVLYDSATQPSQANGKLGVRSNVGESVSVTATGSKVMASIGASVSGAESVTMNGVTTDITSSTVVLPLLDTTATLTFNPASETERIEISTILPEADFKITNENLIRATVSLRSDLSILEPTLPESEINIEAYFNEDVSEAVAQIPEDVPVIYQAGYEGDMSPERKFYVSGQVTWADNVLSIHAVDAVHFLDVQIDSPIYWSGSAEVFRVMYFIVEDLAGITLINKERYGNIGYESCAVIEKSTGREIISNIMHWMKDRISPNSPYYGPFIPCYVDAGRPSLYFREKTPAWSISENDCGDIKRDVDRTYATLELSSYYATRIDWTEVGTFSWYKGSGAFIELGDYVYDFEVCFKNDAFKNGASSTTGAYDVLPSNEAGTLQSRSSVQSSSYGLSGFYLYSSESNQGAFKDIYDRSTVYTQVIPWNKYYSPDYRWHNVNSQAQFWSLWVSRGNIESNTEVMDGVLWGSRINKEEYIKEVSLSSSGGVLNAECSGIFGTVYSENGKEIFPENMVKTHFMQSHVTGSFTWKGDPRMQPRDVVEWERLDGTTETITLENITITHEGGGTSAEITYRKGVV